MTLMPLKTSSYSANGPRSGDRARGRWISPFLEAPSKSRRHRTSRQTSSCDDHKGPATERSEEGGTVAMKYHFADFPKPRA